MPTAAVATVGTAWLGLGLGERRSRNMDCRHDWIDRGRDGQKAFGGRLTRGSGKTNDSCCREEWKSDKHKPAALRVVHLGRNFVDRRAFSQKLAGRCEKGAIGTQAMAASRSECFGGKPRSRKIGRVVEARDGMVLGR
jgi:hypothetical protein